MSEGFKNLNKTRLLKAADKLNGKYFLADGARVFPINGGPEAWLNKGSKAVAFYEGVALFRAQDFYTPVYWRNGNDPDPGGDHAWDNGGFWGDLHDAERW